MRYKELILEEKLSKDDFVEMFKKFLTIAMDILNIDTLPKMEFEDILELDEQPSFGMYIDTDNILYVALKNRHPVDILRTLAHELVHYKQNLEGKIGPGSGKTGSPIENEAHAIAGIIMRHFNKQYPQYLKTGPV